MNQTKANNLFRVKRRAAGLTMAQLADRVGTSKQAVSYWESGDSWPNPRFIPKLAKVFNQTAESLALELEEARVLLTA